MVGLDTRTTMDMDATIKGLPVNDVTVRQMLEEICKIELNDEVTFLFRSIGEIREDDDYTGYRVHLTANYSPMAVPLKLDITTGDKITPREMEYHFMLEQWKGYQKSFEYASDVSFSDACDTAIQIMTEMTYLLPSRTMLRW